MTHTQQSSSPQQSPLFNALAWRCIGPPRGGRVVAVAGDPVNPAVFYFGACAGGVWKTDDGGTYWTNVSDGYVKTASVGAIAVADSDPNVTQPGYRLRRCPWSCLWAQSAAGRLPFNEWR